MLAGRSTESLADEGRPGEPSVARTAASRGSGWAMRCSLVLGSKREAACLGPTEPPALAFAASLKALTPMSEIGLWDEAQPSRGLKQWGGLSRLAAATRYAASRSAALSDAPLSLAAWC
jgi:hypothetical protein